MGFPVKISSDRNLKFTVHLYMNTLPRSNDLLIYSTGYVERNGYPNRSCNPAHILRQIIVSVIPQPMSNISKTPGAYSNIFILIDTV